MEKRTLIIGVGVGLLAAGILYFLSRGVAMQTSSTPVQGAVQQYKNNEKWEIARDGDKAITSINVIRDAKVGSN